MNKHVRRLILGLLLIAVAIGVYLFVNTNKAMIAVPDAFCFSIEGEEHIYDIYHLDEAIKFDPDILHHCSEWDKDAVHLFISNKYLDNEWNYVYITGMYWYSPFKPTVTVNDQSITNIKTNSDGYSAKLYHFYLYGVKENKQYTITVRCGDDRERVKVVFHPE